MDPLDAEKTSFSTPMGSSQCTFILLGLTNASATYQREMILTVHDMLHGCLEDYVDESF